MKTEVKIDKGDVFIRLLTSRKLRIVRHLIGLLPLFLLTFARWGEPEFPRFYDMLGKVSLLLVIIALFYTNMYVLIPRYVYRQRPLLYVAYLVVAFIVMLGLLKILMVTTVEPHRIIPKKDNPGLVAEFVVAVIFLLFLILPSTALKIFQRWATDEQRIGELERKALESELEALRNQVNPHFLFNMLNNVNVLIRKDPQKASLIILKLSDFLRYHLYQSNDPQVFLTTEIRFLTDMLNIEYIRRDDFLFKIDHDPAALKGLRVPPNIFVIFIENAVKHSANPTGPSKVSVSFEIEGSTLLFSCVNSKAISGLQGVSGGLGLANVRRRLELLYGDKYELTVVELEATYQVILRMPI